MATSSSTRPGISKLSARPDRRRPKSGKAEITTARRGGRFLGTQVAGRGAAPVWPPRFACVSYRSKSRRGGCSWGLLMTLAEVPNDENHLSLRLAL